MLNWVYFFYSPSQSGLYRLSGADRTVKELKEKFLRGKTVPVLSRVDDIHAITGLLKDFLRNLKEPLLTFRLNRPFMEAAGTSVWLCSKKLSYCCCLFLMKVSLEKSKKKKKKS